MTKVRIDPGICGLKATVTAVADDEEMEVRLKVSTGCKAIQDMFEELGDTFDTYELCLQKPGEGPLYDYAKQHFPVHVSCPVIPGIIKCAEVDAKLALKKNAYIEFMED
ncbi:MAG: hypothetical protein IJ072_02430 [Oscillospiraceae bacterium]|nr:hypothetical protein [Oscillospiraceae bacterium]